MQFRRLELPSQSLTKLCNSIQNQLKLALTEFESSKLCIILYYIMQLPTERREFARQPATSNLTIRPTAIILTSILHNRVDVSTFRRFDVSMFRQNPYKTQMCTLNWSNYHVRNDPIRTRARVLVSVCLCCFESLCVPQIRITFFIIVSVPKFHLSPPHPHE